MAKVKDKKTGGGTALIAEALGVRSNTVPPDARMGEFELWDSLAHLRILLTLEGALGRQLKAEEAVRIETVADIDEALESQRT